MAQQLVLNAQRTISIAALVAFLSVTTAISQPAPSTPAASEATSLFASYDVVSVKPSEQNARPSFVGLADQPDGIKGEFVTVAMMVQEAYGAPGNITETDAVTGLPDWAKSDYFSVNARMGPQQMAQFTTLSKDEKHQARRTMLQTLLEDRFKVKVHRVSRQVLAYDLVVAKGGSLLKEADSNPDTPRISPKMAALIKGPNGSMFMTVTPDGAEKMIVQGWSTGKLAASLTRVRDVNHTVVDKTGLTGKYTYTLTFAGAGGVGPARAAADSAASDPVPTIFQALSDQLGLRLQRSTATVDTAVVDHVERPTAN